MLYILYFTSLAIGMIDKKYTYAVIGASNNKEKYGYKVFFDLHKSGYKAFPINPNETNNILEQKVYPTLTKLNKTIDVVIFVVPPKVTESILQEVKKLGIKNVRMQPGAESKVAIKYCEENNIKCIHNACIMIQKKQ